MLKESDFKALVDFKAHEDMVANKLKSIGDAYDTYNRIPLLQFFSNYVSWNGYFAGGVANLSASITKQRDLFRDKKEKLDLAADRSNYIASFFFDAARVEYDEKHCHRSLAQAFLISLCQHTGPRFDLDDEEYIKLNKILEESDNVAGLNKRVLTGYGDYPHKTEFDLFHSMGYHAGSEILADAEFSIIDTFFKERYPELRKKLLGTQVKKSEAGSHPSYAWIAVHSGHGDAVEQDHFEAAVRGVHKAIEFVNQDIIDEANAEEAVKQGFKLFAEQHKAFFSL